MVLGEGDAHRQGEGEGGEGRDRVVCVYARVRVIE